MQKANGQTAPVEERLAKAVAKRGPLPRREIQSLRQQFAQSSPPHDVAPAVVSEMETACLSLFFAREQSGEPVAFTRGKVELLPVSVDCHGRHSTRRSHAWSAFAAVWHGLKMNQWRRGRPPPRFRRALDGRQHSRRPLGSREAPADLEREGAYERLFHDGVVLAGNGVNLQRSHGSAPDREGIANAETRPGHAEEACRSVVAPRPKRDKLAHADLEHATVPFRQRPDRALQFTGWVAQVRPR